MPDLILELWVYAAYAIYATAIQPYYALFPYKQNADWFAERVNGKFTLQDLNILAPNPFCQVSVALYSAGLAYKNEHLDCIVKCRDRSTTTIIGDSGGYQVNRGLLGPLTNLLRLKILRWLEEMCDVGFNLDVPLKAIDFPWLSGFHTFEECLDETIVGLKYFCDKRQNSDLRLLNVLQGTNQENADRWYKAVREFKLEGFAFAGVMKTDFNYVCRRLLQMIDRGEINSNTWIHFLGAGSPSVAVVLTFLKRAMRKARFSNFEVSYDTSSPFLMAGRYTKATSGLRFGSDTFTTAYHQMPINAEECAGYAPFPFRSPIGKRLVMGDLMHKKIVGEGAWDQTGHILLANHNIHAETSSIIMANKLIDMNYRLPGLVPYEVQETAQAVWDVITSGTPGKYLDKNKAALERFATHGKEDEDSDWVWE